MFELGKGLKKKKKISKEEKPINKTEKKNGQNDSSFALDNKISRRESFRVTNVTDWESKILLSQL